MASNGRRRGRGSNWDWLTFDRNLTKPVIHLIYWAGLGVVALFGFGTVGAAVGVALREPNFSGWLLAIPVIVAGLLIVAALVLVWRAFCEFYAAIIRISEDLHAIRVQADAEAARTQRRPAG